MRPTDAVTESPVEAVIDSAVDLDTGSPVDAVADSPVELASGWPVADGAGTAGLALAPGARVLRRGPDLIEVRLGERAARTAPVAQVREVLQALAEHRAPTPRDAAGHRFLEALLRERLVVPAPQAARGGASAEVRTAIAARAGLETEARWARREAVAVTVVVDPGLVAAERVRHDAVDALRRAGLQVADAAADPADETALGLMLLAPATGAALADAWTAAGAPYLVLTLAPDGVRLGPFVVPGATACPRCLEAHHADRDPRHRLLTAQLAELPAPLPDPALLAWGCAAAGVDLVRAVEGDLPRTWSASTDLRLDPDEPDQRPAPDPGDLQPATTHWRRHPACGCAWSG